MILVQISVVYWDLWITVRETNTRPLANANAFWTGWVENWPGWVEFCIEHIYKGHLFSGKCSINLFSHIGINLYSCMKYIDHLMKHLCPHVLPLRALCCFLSTVFCVCTYEHTYYWVYDIFFMNLAYFIYECVVSYDKPCPILFQSMELFVSFASGWL